MTYSVISQPASAVQAAGPRTVARCFPTAALRFPCPVPVASENSIRLTRGQQRIRT